MTMLSQGSMPALMYGVKAQGEAPAAIRRARKDPALELPRAQLRAWFDLYAHRADLRELISKVWYRIYERPKRSPPQHRWRQRRGVIGSLILTLWEAGWDPVTATLWTDHRGDDWDMKPEAADKNPAAIIDAIVADIEAQLWKAAA
eukprot:6679520-Pyramimonas_sp.AAC.1